MVDTCKGDLKKSCRRLRGERFCYSRGGQLQERVGGCRWGFFFREGEAFPLERGLQRFFREAGAFVWLFWVERGGREVASCLRVEGGKRRKTEQRAFRCWSGRCFQGRVFLAGFQGFFGRGASR